MALEFDDKGEINKGISMGLSNRLKFLYSIPDWESFFVEFGKNGIFEELEARFKKDTDFLYQGQERNFVENIPDAERLLFLEKEINNFGKLQIRNTVFKNIYEEYKTYTAAQMKEIRGLRGAYTVPENEMLFDVINETKYFVINEALMTRIKNVCDGNKDISPAQVWLNTAKAVFDFTFANFKDEIGCEFVFLEN